MATKLNTATPLTRTSKVPLRGLQAGSLSFLATLSQFGLIDTVLPSTSELSFSAERLNRPHDLQASMTIVRAAFAFALLLVVLTALVGFLLLLVDVAFLFLAGIAGRGLGRGSAWRCIEGVRRATEL